jgi:opacity protein-like surface antigen
MKRMLTTVAVLLAITSGASPAWSEDDDGPGRWYVEARGGLSSPAKAALSDMEMGGRPVSTLPPAFQFPPGTFPFPIFGPTEMGIGDLVYDFGWMAALAGGFQINDYFRAELEASYRDAGIRKIDLRNYGKIPAGGGAKMVAGLVNGYFDIRRSPDQPIVPFLSAGVGGGYLDLELATPLFPGFAYSTKEAVFVWNAGFGVLWSVTRHVGLSLAYRYIGVPDVTVPSVDPTALPLEMPYGAHESFLGLRYTF